MSRKMTDKEKADKAKASYEAAKEAAKKAIIEKDYEFLRVILLRQMSIERSAARRADNEKMVRLAIAQFGIQGFMSSVGPPIKLVDKIASEEQAPHGPPPGE